MILFLKKYWILIVLVLWLMFSLLGGYIVFHGYDIAEAYEECYRTSVFLLTTNISFLASRILFFISTLVLISGKYKTSILQKLYIYLYRLSLFFVIGIYISNPNLMVAKEGVNCDHRILGSDYDRKDVDTPLDYSFSGSGQSGARLINGDQGGMYSFIVDTEYQGGHGVVYVKVFDDITGEPLSEERIMDRSKREVMLTGKSVIDTDFVIYEGSWGYFYPARIQLRFKKNTGEEKLIVEKKYKVEGWNR